MQRLSGGKEEAKANAEKLKTEAETTAMAAYINETPKGEETSGQRGCDCKEEKEPAPITVE